MIHTRDLTLDSEKNISGMNEPLDYEDVTLEYNGDMAEHEQDYRTTAKVGTIIYN